MGINNIEYSIKRKNRLAAFLFIMGAILIFLFCLRGYISYFGGPIPIEKLKSLKLKGEYVQIETDFLLGPFAGYDYGMGETSDKAYIIPIDENKQKWIAVYVKGKKAREFEELKETLIKASQTKDRSEFKNYTVNLKGTILNMERELKKYYLEFTKAPYDQKRTFLPLIIQVDKVPSSIDGIAIDITVMWLLTGLSFFLVTAASYLIIKSEKDSYLGYLKDYCEKSSSYEYTWQKINELCSEKPLIKNVWINEKWMLFRIEKYLYIMDIDNIVWIYLEEARSNYSRKPIYGLCIAEETKKKYCIPITENETWIIDYLFKIHKRALFGYNEEWQRLFENEFEKFKRFARKIN
ncbi:hypothetical protein DXA30_05460 [Fusobacterium ulcerans]|uniref:DUF6709 family protein n=1 Tax=Fusobacterium ulcerans TaxID=861 RepID=UPI000E524D41|nr:DUF6709 family protein [Fusobacterium ulcerans]RGY65343.1 hypothetical protein DXA30_05460 [Fusobacterium ulcerans]